jgi:TolB-like protein/Flp pilus assembly protein TadD
MGPRNLTGVGVRRGGEPSTQEVHDQLARVLASRQFVRSQRLARFLRFAVEQVLAGAGDQVKEYLVGVEVFDRKESYDPRVDPIVRVEARRLRSKLQDYYRSAGQDDPVVIELPTGAYTPAIQFRASKAKPAAAEPSVVSIAVLPFSNLSSDTSDEYFSDGLTEELINLLTRVEGLRVVAWHSASRMRGHEEDLESIREKLKVEAVLRGSVRRTGARMRVTAQLIDTKSGAFLWSEAYDRQISDVLAVQEEIALAIAARLQHSLIAKPTPQPRKLNVPSYDLFLQARFHANRRTPEGIQKSLRCYEQAVATDPESAVAHAGLADSLNLMADYGIKEPSEVIPRAEAAALRALELDPYSAEANTSLAGIRAQWQWKWDEAGELYRRAISLNPGYAKARHWYSIDYLALLGRFEEAEKEIAIARELDPLSMITQEGTGYLNLLRRDYVRAVQGYRDLIELDPSFYKAYSGLGRALMFLKRYDAAISMLEKARSLAGKVPSLISAMGQTLAAAGLLKEARACLEELRVIQQRRHVNCTSFGIIHMALGEIPEALTCFEQACERREFPISGMKVHPLYDPVRSEPRFEAILKRANFLP